MHTLYIRHLHLNTHSKQPETGLIPFISSFVTLSEITIVNFSTSSENMSTSYHYDVIIMKNQQLKINNRHFQSFRRKTKRDKNS